MAEGTRIGLLRFDSTDAEDALKVWLASRDTKDIEFLFSQPIGFKT